MIDVEIYHALGRSISRRASLATEFHQKLAEQDVQDTKLRALLTERAPAELREWLNEDGILSSLFTYGCYDTKINYKNEYGFTNFEDIKTKLDKLRKAWKNVVLIRIDNRPEDHRVKVWFSAVM